MVLQYSVCVHIMYTQLNYGLPEKYIFSQINLIPLTNLTELLSCVTTVSVAGDAIRNKVSLLTELIFGVGRQMLNK